MLEMDGSEIKDSLDAIPKEEYQEVLQHILEQKNKQLKDADPYIRKGKLIRHALSRGFETRLIIGIADTLVG
jgi:regulatory protein